MGASRITAEEIAKARAMRFDKKTWTEIGEVLGRSGTGMRNACISNADQFMAKADEKTSGYDEDFPGEIIVKLYGKEVRSAKCSPREAVDVIENMPTWSQS
jgi:hypothetical protein